LAKFWLSLSKFKQADLNWLVFSAIRI